MVAIMAKRTPEYEVDEMRRVLKKNGFYWTGLRWEKLEQETYADLRQVQTAQDLGRKEGRREAAADVIRAFGLAESYPDVTEEKTGTRNAFARIGYGAYCPESYTYTVTTPGAVAFLADVATVATSRDVAEASKRLGLKK